MPDLYTGMIVDPHLAERASLPDGSVRVYKNSHNACTISHDKITEYRAGQLLAMKHGKVSDEYTEFLYKHTQSPVLNLNNADDKWKYQLSSDERYMVILDNASREEQEIFCNAARRSLNGLSYASMSEYTRSSYVPLNEVGLYKDRASIIIADREK
eukprot:8498-Heterococcus_DN1.PRE.2